MLNKSEFLFVILTFFVLVSIIMGVIGNSLNENMGADHKAISGQDFFIDASPTNGEDKNLFQTIVSGYQVFPVWVNFIVFTPIIITLFYIILSSLPLLNGGG